jgi:hypothetical protein
MRWCVPLSIIVGAFFLFSCDDGKEKPLDAPVLVDFSQEEGCIGAVTPALAAAGFKTYVNGDEIEVVHSGVKFNCCLAAIKKDIVYDEALRKITLLEKTVQGDLSCNCTCEFEPFWRVRVHQTGTFTVEVKQQLDEGAGSTVYSTSVMVTGKEEQVFPEHEPSDTELPAEFGSDFKTPKWPGTISSAAPTYSDDAALLTAFGMAGATRSGSGADISYKTDAALLSVQRTAAAFTAQYQVLRDRVYFLAATKADYDKTIADHLTVAKNRAAKLTTLPLVSKVRATPYDTDPNAGNIPFAATLFFAPTIQGFAAQNEYLSLSFDTQGLIAADLTLPNLVTPGASTPAASKAQIKTALQEALSLDKDPTADRIRWLLTTDGKAYRARYFYTNPSTMGTYSIAMEKGE